MESNPLVSVIVPIYGTEKYLPNCIESLLGQTYTNIQIILVDDQSPDQCPKICDDYAEKDSRITVIHQANRGVSGARNTGLRCATGDYIMFVDSDDEIYPNAIEVLLQDICKYKADIVWAPQKNRDNEKQIEDFSEDGTYTTFCEEDALYLSLAGVYNINAVWGKFFKKSFIKGIFFEEGKHINEDGFFMFLCYMKKPIMVQHDISVYQYNIRSDSSSRQTFSEKYLSMLYFCERKKELIATHYPQYLEQAYNMEVRTNLQFLQVLCRTCDKQYKTLANPCIRTVRHLYRYHKPINGHHKKLAWIVAHGLYPLYKKIVRLKYYR